MPGGIPPRRRTDTVFNEIVLSEPVEGSNSWTWKCKHCMTKFTWASTKRTRLHLACLDKLISHCTSVSDEVREREAAIVNRKSSLKRKRKEDAQAFENADMERKKRNSDRLMEKIKRGICVVRDGKTIKTRIRKGSLGTGDSLSWALLDEALVDFCCLNGLSVHLIDSKGMKNLLNLARATSKAYRPPSSRNDGRASSFEHVLMDRQAEVNAQVDEQLARISSWHVSAAAGRP